jgi:hypothetical protein
MSNLSIRSAKTVQAPTNAPHAGQSLARLSIREQRGDLAAPPGPADLYAC